MSPPPTDDAPDGRPRRLAPDDVPAFVRDVLLSPDRGRPVVGLSTNTRVARLLVDADRLAADLAGHAEVVILETGEVTWALSQALPPRLDVYGGAARIWWPGLTPAANPHDHPLMFIWSPDDVPRVEARVRAAILGRDARAGRFGEWSEGSASGGRGPARAAPAGSPAAPAAEEYAHATLAEVGEHAVRVDVGGEACLVDPADCRPEDVPGDIRPGHALRVRRTARTLDGLPVVEVRDVRQDPWRRLTEVYQEGDVVRGRVQRVEASWVLVEVLPGAALMARISELDWNFVRSPADLFRVGERVKAKILSLEPERHRGLVSIKQAYAEAALPAVAPGLGLPPFLGDEDETDWSGESAAEEAEEQTAPDSADELARELAAVLEDRAGLMEANRALKAQVAELRREVRSGEDRLRDVQSRVSGDLDPTESEVAFLAAVRVAYARRFDEGDRQRYPLGRMRVGREFLARVKALEGVSLEKVIEVCAQVACQRAHEIKAREVHPLRSGPAGAPARDRARDGARAWRCSLQDNTPSARRLHWWDVPGPDGRIIEFASVGVHDDYSIPE